MATPIPDLSHLTPDERIELAKQLRDGLDAEAVGPDDEQGAQLRRRRAAPAADGDLGAPWRAVLDGVAGRGG